MNPSGLLGGGQVENFSFLGLRGHLVQTYFLLELRQLNSKKVK
jgi:hypothetical protein